MEKLKIIGILLVTFLILNLFSAEQTLSDDEKENLKKMIETLREQKEEIENSMKEQLEEMKRLKEELTKNNSKFKEQQLRDNMANYEKVKEFYSQFNPKMEDELKELSEKNRSAYIEALRRYETEYKYLNRLKEEFPDRFKESLEQRRLSEETRKLAKEFRDEKDKDVKNKYEKELREKLNTIFDLKEKEKQAELERIKNRLEVLATEIEERRKVKDQIIQKRFEELTGEKELYKW